MRSGSLWRYVGPVLLVGMVIGAADVFAVTSSSPNYQMVESEFGAGTNLESCSDEYCARSTIGSLTVGGGEAGDHAAEFGPITNGEPSLDVIVEAGTSDLGVFTTDRTATATMQVRVRNYLSNGYVMQVVGEPPKYGDHILHTPSTPTTSTKGTEQFAINAVANTEPTVGENVVQVPNSQMSFGTVETGYDTPDMFQYTSGDVVGRSLSESGQTNYTISMILNISSKTPAGHYSGDFTAVVIPVY